MIWYNAFLMSPTSQCVSLIFACTSWSCQKSHSVDCCIPYSGKSSYNPNSNIKYAFNLKSHMKVIPIALLIDSKVKKIDQCESILNHPFLYCHIFLWGPSSLYNGWTAQCVKTLLFIYIQSKSVWWLKKIKKSFHYEIIILGGGNFFLPIVSIFYWWN